MGPGMIAARGVHARHQAGTGSTPLAANLQRNGRFVLGIVQHKRCFDIADMRPGCEPRYKFLKGRHVGRDAFEDEVNVAGQHPAFAHHRLGAHIGLKGAQIGLRLTGEMDQREHRDLETQLAAVEQAAIAGNIARFLQRPDPAQAGRRRNSSAGGEIDIGNPAIGLNFLQNF